MDKPQPITREGLVRIEEELRQLETVRRPEVAEKIKQAKELSSTENNAEYEDAKNEQAMLELTQYALRSPERHPLAVAQYRRYAELAAQALEAAAAQVGAPWRVPVAEAAGVLVAFTDGLTITWLVNRDDDAARAVVRAAADALSRMADSP